MNLQDTHPASAARSRQRSVLVGFSCLSCGAEYEHGHFPLGCKRCRETTPSSLVARYDYDAVGTAADAAVGGDSPAQGNSDVHDDMHTDRAMNERALDLRERAGIWRDPAWSVTDRDAGISAGQEPGVWRFAPLLPIRDPACRITLHEGSTPLLGPYPRDDGGRIWLKNESISPTWSYKDRLAAVGVSAAREAGARTVAVSSSGNHGAAVAAYAAAAGLESVVVTNHDVSPATLALIHGLGGRVVLASREGRRELLACGVESAGWYPLSSLVSPHVGNPYAVEGYKTIAFELAEQLAGRLKGMNGLDGQGGRDGQTRLGGPDGLGGLDRVAVAVPTCYGEGLAGIAAGFADLVALGRLDAVPRLIAVEPEGGAPLHRARLSGEWQLGDVAPYRTVAGSIAGTNSSWRALRALREHDGWTAPVLDDEIVEAQRWLGAETGIFAELSGAAALAAIRSWSGEPSGERPALPEDVVVLVTGGGLRTAEQIAGRQPHAPVVHDDADDPDQVIARLEERSRDTDLHVDQRSSRRTAGNGVPPTFRTADLIGFALERRISRGEEEGPVYA